MRKILICMLVLALALGAVSAAAGEAAQAVSAEELYSPDVFQEAWYQEVCFRIFEKAGDEDASEALNIFSLASFDSAEFISGILNAVENDEVTLIFWAMQSMDTSGYTVPIGFGLSLKYCCNGVDCAGLESIQALIDLAVRIYGGTEEEIARLNEIIGYDMEWDIYLMCDDWMDPVYVPFGSAVAKFRCFEEDGHIEVVVSAQDQIKKWSYLGIQFQLPEGN